MAAADSNSDVPIFHMCEVTLWESSKEKGSYVPPTYEQDGFIHATAEPQFLIDVANHFYRESTGDWICIKIDPKLLGGSKVIYEAPAPVGNTEAYDHKEKDDEQPKFPHIYGPIPTSACVSHSKILRDADGTFLSIEN